MFNFILSLFINFAPAILLERASSFQQCSQQVDMVSTTRRAILCSSICLYLSNNRSNSHSTCIRPKATLKKVKSNVVRALGNIARVVPFPCPALCNFGKVQARHCQEGHLTGVSALD